jgi:hypothetical protein
MKTFLAHLIVGLGAAFGTAPLASAAGATRWRLGTKRLHSGALLRRPSTAAVGAGRRGIGSHSVAILVERPVSLTEHDCLALGAAYNGW